jgi:hypothetical protein
MAGDLDLDLAFLLDEEATAVGAGAWLDGLSVGLFVCSFFPLDALRCFLAFLARSVGGAKELLGDEDMGELVRGVVVPAIEELSSDKEPLSVLEETEVRAWLVDVVKSVSVVVVVV